MTGLGFLWIVFFSLVIFLYGCQSIDSKRQILLVTLWFNIFLWLHITLSLNSLTWHTVSLMISLLPVSSLVSVYSSTFMQRFRLRWLLVAHWIYNVILYAVCSFILEAVLLFCFYWLLLVFNIELICHLLGKPSLIPSLPHICTWSLSLFY